MGIKITERDLAIIHFINECGFCEIPQIEKRFAINRPRSYQVMQRLVLAGLVLHKRIFYERPGIFQLSKQGAEHTDLPPIKKIPVGIYNHQIVLAEVSIKLQQRYPQARWISERHLRRDQFRDGVGKRGHVPDGILVFPDGRKIAIEVELTLKGKDRIGGIFRWYLKQGSDSIKEVWYYCSQDLIPVLTSLAGKMPFIKILNIYELLP